MTDSVDALFVRVIEAGSFKAAAEQTGADPSAVSRRMAALEAKLGVKLLQRSTKRTTATEPGMRYYEGLRGLIDAKAALEADVTGLADQPRGRLKVAAAVDFGARFVAPVIAHLQDRHPELAIDLSLGSSFVDLSEQDIDVAIRIGRLPDSSLIARRLGSVPRVIVAGAAYAAQNTLPQTPDALGEHPFVFYQQGQREGSITLSQNGETTKAAIKGRTSANSITAVRTLVLEGLGLHFGPIWAFEDELARKEVLPVLPDYALAAYPLHAVYVASSFVPAKTRVFIDAMADAVKRSPSLNSRS